MIGAATEAFAVLEDTPVDDLLWFRDKHADSLGRFRAAMADMAAALRKPEVAPEAALSAARDVYRNRVEPSLGALESRLTESRLKFVARSIFGAAALTVAPMSAPSVVQAGATLAGQTIRYRFSRERLLEDHPYGYLHRLSRSDFVVPSEHFSPQVVSSSRDPAEAVHGYFEHLYRAARELDRAGRQY